MDTISSSSRERVRSASLHIPNEQWQDSKQQRGTSFEKDRFATTKKKEYEVKRSPIQERGFHLQTSQELRSRLAAVLQ